MIWAFARQIHNIELHEWPRIFHRTVFNIGVNKARLIAAIHYNRRRVYIRAILTHDEYNRGKWKE